MNSLKKDAETHNRNTGNNERPPKQVLLGQIETSPIAWNADAEEKRPRRRCAAVPVRPRRDSVSYGGQLQFTVGRFCRRKNNRYVGNGISCRPRLQSSWLHLLQPSCC